MATVANELDVTAVVRGPNAIRCVRLTCDTSGGEEYLKEIGHRWWRPLLVAFCRREWGDGTLKTVSDSAMEFEWGIARTK